MAMLIFGCLLAIVLGIIPVYLGLFIVLGLILVIVSVFEPILALCLAIVLGPSKALLSTVWPELPIYPGQILFVLFVITWLFRFVVNTDNTLKFATVTKYLMVYLGFGLYHKNLKVKQEIALLP